LARHCVISREDLDLFQRLDSAGYAFDFIISELNKTAVKEPGGRMQQTF
jgi:hypothetical protein